MTQVTGINGSSRTNTGGHAPSPSQYHVHKGDTLSGIAARHGVSLGALERANPAIASQRFIFPGDKLMIPSGSHASAQNTASHTIQRGETLSSIAAKHGTSVDAIAHANPGTIKNVNHIYPGDTIVIPSEGHAAPLQHERPAVLPRRSPNQPTTQIASRGASNTSVLQPGRASLKLIEADFVRAAKTLGVNVATIKAVAEVESRGNGFLLDGRPVILFERHKFSGFTSHAFDASHSGISKKNAGGYGKGGANQYTRLSEAMSLNETAALKSASWGKFQIMGFNHKALGYETVQAFVADMRHSEGRQLDAFVKFVEVNGLAKHLRSGNWAAFAKGYNGSNYAINQYDTKLATEYARFANNR